MADTSGNQPVSDNPALARRGLVPMPRPTNQATRSAYFADNIAGQRPNQTVSPGFVLASVRMWWHVALPVGLLLAGTAACALWFFSPEAYEASVLLRISEAEPFVVSRDNDQSHYERVVETEMNLMRSHGVIEDALRNVFHARSGDDVDRFAEALKASDMPPAEFAELMDVLREEDPVRWLSGELRLAPVKGSELVNVSFSCRHARNAQQILNAVMSSYLRYHESERLARMKYVLDELERAKKEQESLVRNLRSQLESKTVGTVKKGPSALIAEMPAGLERSEGNEVASRNRTQNLQSLLFESELQVATLKSELDELRRLTSDSTAARTPADSEAATSLDGTLEPEVEKALDSDPELQSMLAVINERKINASHFRERAIGGEQHPSQIAYKKQCDQIASMEASYRSARAEKHDLVRARQRDLLVAQSRSRYSQAQSRLNVLRDWLDSERNKLGEYRKDVLGMEFLKNELNEADSLYSLVSERILRLNIEQRAPDRITPIPRDLAPLPKAPNKGPVYRSIALAATACMIAPFALAVLWEMRTRRVSTRRQLELATRIPVLGEIAPLPALPTRASTSRSRIEYAIFVETVDALRTRLLLNESPTNSHVIAVTSGTAHEGKTSLALQLAMSIGQAMKEVALIVDADMRSPDIHRHLDISCTPGLAELLAGTADLDDAISRNLDTQLHILPAGELRTSPHQLLSGASWPALLEQLRHRYRFIILDTAPALIASESLVLARSADTTLISAIAGVSRTEHVTDIYVRLAETGANPVGIVLSGVRGNHFYRYRDRDYAYTARRETVDAG